MPYEIIYNKAIRDQIRDLPGHIKAIAKQQIAGLSDNPRPLRSKELIGHPHYYGSGQIIAWSGTFLKLNRLSKLNMLVRNHLICMTGWDWPGLQLSLMSKGGAK